MEIEITTDAFDDGNCLLAQQDCREPDVFYHWISKNRHQPISCDKCRLFQKFRQTGKSLAEFREWFREHRAYVIIDGFCEEKYGV